MTAQLDYYRWMVQQGYFSDWEEQAMWRSRRPINMNRPWDQISPQMVSHPAQVGLVAPEAPQPSRHSPLTPPQAKDITIDVLPDAFTRYVELAKEIGVAPQQIAEVELRSTLKRLGFQEYDYKEVWEFLNKLAIGTYNRPCWVPLRTKDLATDMALWNGDEKAYTYKKLVPIEGLVAVKQISGEIPEARFYVSDYYAANPDPFLLVANAPGSYAVVLHWDEPKWEMRKAE